jgi:hypothetical protein
MSGYYETGHIKNGANLLKLNQTVTTFGATYNPSNNAIKLAALGTLATNANTKLTDVSTNFTNWKNATNARELAFDPLRKEVTQILGALQSLGVPQQTIDDFAFQVNKFRSSGSKLTKADAGIADTTTAEKTVDPNAEPDAKTISTSQQSFDNLIQHFQKMILILQSVPTYNPNETAFKIVTLQTQFTNLNTLNNAANTSYATLKNARIQRNLFFYAKDTGALDIVKQAKAYVKSVYGASSQQYIAVNAIKFTRVVSKKSAQ